MECHACGASVVEGQKFCHECGQSMKGVTEPTQELEPEVDSPGDRPRGAQLADPAPAAGDVEPAGDRTPGTQLPSLADLPTKEIAPREPLPDPTWASRATDETPVGGTELFDDLTRPTPAEPMAAIDDPAPGPTPPDGTAATPTDEVLATTQMDAVGATTVLASSAAITTDEFPAVFDGSADVQHFPPPREPFKLRLMFVLGFFGAIATLMSSAADITDVRTSTPVDGIAIGITTLADIGVNLPVAGFVGAAVMALGGLVACFGLRWGAGLAGGGGLAVAGWAGLVIGLAEVPIAEAESITRTNTSLPFTLTVTRDLGYWLVVAAGATGLVVFLASLRLAGTGGWRSLNPWVAAVGAVSTVILAAGPLLPEGDATFENNFRSPTVAIDLPTAYFAGRLGQVGLIAVAGVVGFLLVRTYGLGLAAGGISVAVWLWVSALLGIGENLVRGDVPLGIAEANVGASDTTPHGVTTVGMVLTLTMLLLAAVLAAIQNRRRA